MNLGESLKQIRQAHGLTMREVQERSGVNKAFLSRLETGQLTNPTLRVIRALTKVYQIPPEWWFREEETHE